MTRTASRKRSSPSSRPIAPKKTGILQAIPERVWWLVGPLCVLVQAFASRGALFGVPAADDYDYLFWLRFHPFTLFDSMGSLSYWRPVGRQLYYVATDPFLFRAPWVVGVLHGALLLAVFALVYRIARRAYSPPISASIAAFPLLAEPLRTLLVWPTGGEYLLALAFTALAVHEVFFERPATSALAMLAALLSHEASGLALVAIPAIAWRRGSGTIRWAGWMAGVALLWLAGHQIAHARGAGWLAAGSLAAPAGRFTQALVRSLVAELSFEDAGRTAVVWFWAAYAAIGVVGAVIFARERSARDRLRRHGAAILASSFWFVAGVASLALLLPDWNGWRTALPALWLGVAVAGTLGDARPILAVALLVVRLGSLAVVPPAPSILPNRPPETTSGISFQRVARFQRAADGVRRELLRAHPTLPRGSAVRYWARPQGTAISLVEDKAIRVWYGDSTLTWSWVWSADGRTLESGDPVLGFDVNTDRVAVVLEPAAVTAAGAGNQAMREERWPIADSLFAVALSYPAAGSCHQFAGWAVKRRIAIALHLGENVKAESLNATCRVHLGENATSYGVDAVLALRRGDATQAAAWAELSLARDPQNGYGLYVMRRLRGETGGTPMAGD